MKPIGIVGIILIAIGIISLAYGGFSYTTREKLVETPIGDLTAKKEHTVPLPPILGGLCLVGGIALLVSGRNRG